MADEIPIWATNATWSTGEHTTAPTKVEPDPSAIADGLIGGDSVKVQHLNWILNRITAVLPHFREGVYGPGSDGNVTINSQISLSRTMYYDNLTVVSGQHLDVNGHIVFVRGTLTLEDGATVGSIGNNGAHASAGGTGADGRAAGTLNGSAGGGQGGQVTGQNGSAGGSTDANSSLGGAGGAGGSDSGSGGNGGSANPPTAAYGGWQQLNVAMTGEMRGAGGTVFVQGGAGGGGGGAGDSGGLERGGGGGGGAGPVAVLAKRIVVNTGGGGGRIISVGGNGGNGGTSSGGGGGGGGGPIWLVTSSADMDAILNSEGGDGGLGTGAGEHGDPGDIGAVTVLRV